MGLSKKAKDQAEADSLTKGLVQSGGNQAAAGNVPVAAFFVKWTPVQKIERRKYLEKNLQIRRNTLDKQTGI